MKRSLVLALIVIASLSAACVSDTADSESETVGTSHAELDVVAPEAAAAPSASDKVAKPEPDPWKHEGDSASKLPLGPDELAKPEPDPWKSDPAAERANPIQPDDTSKPEPDPWHGKGSSDTKK